MSQFDEKKPTAEFITHLNKLITETYGPKEFKEVNIDDVTNYVLNTVNQRIYQRTRQKKERLVMAQLKEKNPEMFK